MMHIGEVFLLFCCCSLAIGQSDYWEQFRTNLRNDINSRVRSNLEGLNDLGPRIQQRVHEGLRPVREMQFRMRLKRGEGGVTVATFNNGQKLIVREGTTYQCRGSISDVDASCRGSLQALAFTKKEDFCFADAKAVVNNWLCLGTGGSTSVSVTNNNIHCSGNDGSPTLIISTAEYNSLCSGLKPVTYRYLTSQALGEYGSDVQCSRAGTGTHVCQYTENAGAGASGANFINVGNVGRAVFSR